MQPALAPLEERKSQMTLQIRDQAAHRRLRDMERFSRRGGRTKLHGSPKSLYLPVVQSARHEGP